MGEIQRSEVNFVWCSDNLEDLISVFNVGTFKFKDQCYILQGMTMSEYWEEIILILRSAKDGDQCLIPRFTPLNKLWLQEMTDSCIQRIKPNHQGGGKPNECNWQI